MSLLDIHSAFANLKDVCTYFPEINKTGGSNTSDLRRWRKYNSMSATIPALAVVAQLKGVLTSEH